jgi:hypothetical protein
LICIYKLGRLPGFASALALVVFCSWWIPNATAQDAAILRRNTLELGGFVGASYGIDKAHITGGGNLTYSVTRWLLPYVEASYFPGIQRTNTQPLIDEVQSYTIPIADVNFGAHIRFRLPKTPIVPYAVIGFGVLHSPQETEKDVFSGIGAHTQNSPVVASSDFATNVGGGVRLYIREQFGIRAEFKAYQVTGGPLRGSSAFKEASQLYRLAFGMFWQFGRS